jgi:endoglucanase
MRVTVWLLAAVVSLFAAVGSASAAAPHVEVKGNHLVDTRNGQVFVPRGVNWPSFEYACYYGYAYSDEGDPRTTHPTAASAAQIASWHINTVRVPLNEACWLGVDGQPAFGDVNGYRAAVRQWVSRLHRAGLVVILDLHWSAPSGVGAEGQRAMADERSGDFWTSVASTFKSDRSIIFDLFNEPYSRYDGDTLVFDLTWDCWRDGGCAAPSANDSQPLDGNTFTVTGMQALVAAVRATGASQPLMLGGLDYANDLGDWLANRPPEDQLVASFHNYETQACHKVTCWNKTIAPIATRVPVVTGEFGETDCRDSHVKSYMSWADRHGVGYLAWAWWVLPDKSCSTLSVLSDLKATPKAPNGTALKSHLAVLVPPRVSLSGPGTQALDGTVEVGVRCSKTCRARATGKLAISTSPRQEFALRTAVGTVQGGRTRTLSVKIPRPALRAAAQALRSGRGVTATVTITATGRPGSAQTRQRKIRLR